MSEWSLPELLKNLHKDIEHQLSTVRRTMGHPGTMGDGSEKVWLDLLFNCHSQNILHTFIRLFECEKEILLHRQFQRICHLDGISFSAYAAIYPILLSA